MNIPIYPSPNIPTSKRHHPTISNNPKRIRKLLQLCGQQETAKENTLTTKGESNKDTVSEIGLWKKRDTSEIREEGANYLSDEEHN